MNNFYDRIAFIQRGRATIRYHTMRMHDHQRIDSHSYGVMMLVLLLTDGPDITLERRDTLMRAAMFHDLAEHITGDIPAPVKRTLGTGWRETYSSYEDELLEDHRLLVSLNEADARVLKMADAAEGCLHCIEERRMGNQETQSLFHNFWSYLKDEQDIDKPTNADAEVGEAPLAEFIMKRWRIVNGATFA